jgi:RNA polymerase sigma-70 factor (ECF subfamily)
MERLTAELDNLLARAKNGDLAAFGEIVLRFERPLRGWLAVRCPPGVDADDLAQAAFLEAFRRLEEYTPGTEFGAWLFTIARYQLLAETTRLRRHADYHSRYVPHALAEELARRAACDRTSDEMDHQLRLLATCIAELSQTDQELLRCRYADNLPLTEMAARFRRTVGALKKHLHVLRQRLRDCVTRKLSASET